MAAHGDAGTEHNSRGAITKIPTFLAACPNFLKIAPITCDELLFGSLLGLPQPDANLQLADA
jgi:hypothetical protein